MPTLRIMSIYQQHQQAFADELSRARSEREQFTATLVARFGREAAEAMRRDARWMQEIFPGRSQLPQLSREICVATKKLQILDRKVLSGAEKDPHRRLLVPRVAGSRLRAGFGGVDVADGPRKVCGRAVACLRGIVAAESPPQDGTRHAQRRSKRGNGRQRDSVPCRLSEKWRRLLQHRRRRLTLLLHTAVMREEDVRWQYPLVAACYALDR